MQAMFTARLLAETVAQTHAAAALAVQTKANQ
jgi:hypothetical protein